MLTSARPPRRHTQWTLSRTTSATPADAGLLAIGVAVMLAVSALAAFLPARRAAAIDPIVVLRDQ
jgi:ABC-type lipoprotein release transport system permease subunit